MLSQYLQTEQSAFLLFKFNTCRFCSTFRMSPRAFLFDSNSLPPKCKAELTAPFQTHPFFRITQRPHIKMDGTFGIKMQNLHCIGRSAARTDKNGCKHTDNDWLVIWKAVPKFITLQRFVLIFCKNGHKVVWLYNLVSKWS